MRSRRLPGLLAVVALAPVAAWAAGACRPLAPAEDVPGEGGPPDAVDEPAATIAITQVKVIPSPTNALVATLTYVTSVPAVGTVTVTNVNDKTGVNVVKVPADAAPVTSHTATLLGMRASATFQIEIDAADTQGDAGVATTRYSTGALPAGFPPVTVVTSAASQMSPGYTLFPVWRWDGTPTAAVNPASSYLVAVDAAGQVVWYAPGAVAGTYVADAQKLPNGDLLTLTGTSGWAEIDMLGNVVSSQAAAGLGLDTLHDELFVEDAGAYLGLSTKLKDVPGYPPGGQAPPDGGPVKGGVTLPVVGDVVAEMSPDGHLMNSWSAFAMLDPYVEGSFFGQGTWNGVYPDAGATHDWTHATSVRADPNDGTYLFSSSAQSWIVKFASQGGTPKIVWRLGPGGDFALTTPNDTLPFNQTSMTVLPSGNILCFDAGTFRVDANGFVPPLFSRAVELSYDLPSMTATIVWQYGETPPFYSSFLGGVQYLDNQDVLIADGGETVNRVQGNPYDPTNLKFARILEVTHDVTPTKVFEIDVNAALGSMAGDSSFSGYSVPRARRVASLY